MRQVYPKVTELHLTKARREAALALGAYVDGHRDAFLLSGGRFLWSPESDPVLPGRSSNGAFRVVVRTGGSSKYAGEIRSLSYIFKVIIGGLDTAQCIQETWPTLAPEAYCSVVIEGPGLARFIESNRILTMKELEDHLRPATTCVVVGGFRNDLPVIWSKDATPAPGVGAVDTSWRFSARRPVPTPKAREVRIWDISSDYSRERPGVSIPAIPLPPQSSLHSPSIPLNHRQISPHRIIRPSPALFPLLQRS